MVSILQTGSYQFLEKRNVSGGRKKSVPGWTNKLYDIHQQAKIDYSNWVNSGKSESDGLVKKMNQSRKKFKKELRKYKRYLKKKFADELANNMIGNHPSIEFWLQIKRLNSTPRCTASFINGITGDQSSAAMWKNHYSQSLNSVGEPVNSKTVQFIVGEEHYMNVEFWWNSICAQWRMQKCLLKSSN